MPAIAYSYMRFSSPEQAKGDSLRRQTEGTEAWAARNGVKLDNSLSLRDEGISAFTGSHRANPDRHALATFLEMVQTGRIKKGSYLIVENLDRLSREHVRAATTLFFSILESEIHIVTTMPERIFRHDSKDMTDIIIAVMELSRGHAESQYKGDRVGKAWQEKRDLARKELKPLGASTPAWIKLADDKYQLRPEAAETVRRIFQMAIEGFGVGAITKRLNSEKVPPIGRKPFWNRSYVNLILHSRQTVGEYQPRTKRGMGQKVSLKRKKKDGDVIPNFYPAVITDKQYWTAQHALQGRRNKGGSPGISAELNVWLGLLKCGRTGCSVIARHKNRFGHKLLVPYQSELGLASTDSFPLSIFEREVLADLSEIDPNDLLPKSNKGGSDIFALAAELAETENKIRKVDERLQNESDADALINALSSLDRKRKAILERLQKAKEKASSPLAEAWGHAQSLTDVPTDNDTRVRLRSALRRIIENVWCIFFRDKARRIALVQLNFKEVDHKRKFVIVYSPQVNSKPAHWTTLVINHKKSKNPEYDLSNTANSKRLEQLARGLLETLQPSNFEFAEHK